MDKYKETPISISNAKHIQLAFSNSSLYSIDILYFDNEKDNCKIRLYHKIYKRMLTIYSLQEFFDIVAMFNDMSVV